MSNLLEGQLSAPLIPARRHADRAAAAMLQYSARPDFRRAKLGTRTLS